VHDDTGHQALTEALHWIDAAFVGDPTDVRSWPVLGPLAPHVRAIAQYADQAAIADPTARLMSVLGQLFYAKVVYTEAELVRQALFIDEQTFGDQHPNVARDLNILAHLLHVTNRLAEAEPLMRRALLIDEQTFGDQHPNVARDLKNLAQLLQDTSRLAEAEPLYRHALAIDEQSLGDQHPDVARTLNNLAQLLQATNRLAEAEPLMRRALVIFEKSFGEDHPYSKTVRNNYTILLEAIG
jgi:tetratricopeptide (TPR) repeat protein